MVKQRERLAGGCYKKWMMVNNQPSDLSPFALVMVVTLENVECHAKEVAAGTQEW
jgi:hypothetical protein